MNEQLPSETEQTPSGTKEIRHDVSFSTVVVGSRHEGPGALLRKGEMYHEANRGIQMSRFLRLSETGQSTGMLIKTKDERGNERRFYVMREGPRGVAAGPDDVSLTDIEKSTKEGMFSTRVVNQERVRAEAFTVGQEFAPGSGLVESILVDTGEHVPIENIDTNSEGQSLYTRELQNAQDAMKQIEVVQHPSPFGY